MSRDKSVLEHIIQYCDDIANTLERFGADYEIFETAISDIPGLKEKCQSLLLAHFPASNS